MAVTNEQLTYTLKAEANNLDKNLANVTKKAKDLDAEMQNLQSSVKKMSSTELEYQRTLQQSAESIQAYNENLSNIATSTKNLSDSIQSTTSVIQDLSTAVSTVSAAFVGLKKAYEIISDPRTMKAAQDILTILQAIAVFKGFDKLADSLETVRKKLETLAAALDKFRNALSGDIFQKIGDLADKSRMFLNITEGIKLATKALVASVAGLASFSILGTIYKDGLNLKSILFNLRETFTNIFSLASKGFGDMITKVKNTKITVENLHDAFTLIGVGGTAIGSFNLMSGGLENITAASLKASAASIAFSLALKGLVIYIGAVIQQLGERLSGAMAIAQEKFAKTQQIVTQFGFVIKNFGEAYGQSFIGTLSQWENQIERLANTTTFSSNELRKSAKLVIAENKALGMSYEENVKFLDRAVEIAASSGMELFEVVQRLQSALVGNATSVAALGINLGAHALEHSNLNKVIQKTVGTMTEQEKKQIALYEIYQQTEPLVGASIKQGETIIGINQQLANSYEQIQSKLGSVNAFSMALSSTYADLIRNISNQPQIFYDIVGTLGDLSGIVLQVVGFTFKWILVITTLVTAYKVLNAIIVTNIALQTKLNAVATFLGMAFQFQAVKVTTAAAALSLLGKTLKTAVIFVFANVTTAIVGATKALGALSVAVLANPLFLKAAAIAASIVFIIKAFDELNKEMNYVQDTLEVFQDSFARVKSAFSTTGRVAASAFSGIVQVIKILILSVAELYQVLKLGYLAFRRLFDPSNGKEYNKMIDATLHTLDSMAQSHTNALNQIATLWDKANGGGTAYGQTMDDFIKKIDEMAFRQMQLNKAAEAIDVSTMRIETLGTEVEKLTNRYNIAAESVNKLSTEILESSEISSDAIKDYQKALEKQTQAILDLEKLRIDTIKSVADITKEVQKESIRLSADETKKINMDYDERVEAVKKLEAQLSRLGPVAGESAKQIIQAYGSIEEGRKKALKALQDKQDKEANENYLKFLKEQNDLLDDIAKRNRELQRDALGDQVTERQKINEMLSFDTEELEKQIEHYRIQWGSQSAIVKGLEKQKGLLKEAAATQQEMADMQLPDWIDKLGESINKAFGRDNIDAFFNLVSEKIDTLKNTEFVVKVRQMTENMTSGPVGEAASATGDVVKKSADLLYAAGGTVGNIASSMGGMVGGFIDVFLNADKYLNILLEFPKTFLKIIENLPALAQKFIDSFPGMIRAIAEALPGIILKLVDMIPNLIAAFLDAIPLLIERLAEAIPEIFIKLVGMIPKLIVMIGRAIFLAIQSLIKGLIRGIGRIFKGMKMPRAEIGTKGIENAAKKLTGSASRMFQVKDLMDAAKDPMMKLTDGVEKAFKKGTDAVKGAWNWVNEKIIQPIFDGLKKVWMWIWDNVIQPIANILTQAWQWIHDKIIAPVIGAFTSVFTWISEKIMKPILNGFMSLFSWINDKIFQPFTSAIQSVFTFVVDKVIAPLSGALTSAFSWIHDNVIKPMSEIGHKIAAPIIDAFNGISNFFKNIGEALKSLFKLDFSGFAKSLKEAFSAAIEPIMKGFKSVMNGIIDFLNNIKIPGVEVGFSVLGKKISFGWGEIDLLPGTIQRLASGGLVGSPDGMGLAGFGTDTVPIAATPGEFIMNRRGVETAGIDMLSMLNRGVSPQVGSGTYNISFEINIDAKQPMDEGFIKATLVPKMKEELKRASLDGQFVLSSRGIR